MNNLLAVRISNAWVNYKVVGPTQEVNSIIQNLSMSVESGKLYGLIGKSGCGKSTLLKCILGQKKLISGTISVFNQNPKDIHSSLIGHMPQDISLLDSLSIVENFEYFGRIYHLSQEEIRQKTEQLINVLDLPNSSRLIRNLSGGEKRRISLGVAMISSPELLILDEFSSGLDPVLREIIWTHLQHLVSSNGVTIIITSHYAEEIRLCDRIGVMERGALIAEDNPHNFLKVFECELIEDALLRLWRRDKEQTIGLDQPINNLDKLNYGGSPIKIKKFLKRTFYLKRSYNVTQTKIPNNFFQDEWNHLYAASKKNFLTMSRQPLFLIITLLLPLVHIIVNLLCVKSDPRGVKLSLVNNEIQCSQSNFNNSQSLSCTFLETLQYDDAIYWKEAPNFEAARNHLVLGQSYGVVSIPKNFSQHLIDRLVLGRFAESKEFVGSTLDISMDMSSQFISTFVIRKLYKSYLDLIQNVAKEFNIDPRVTELPLKFNAIYGFPDGGWEDFFIPANISVAIFVISTIAGVSLALENVGGAIDRSFVAGIKLRHHLISYFISMTPILCMQLIIVYGTFFAVFGYRVQGSLVILVALHILSGWSGIALSQILAVAFHHPLDVVITCLFISLFTMFSSGMAWPLEESVDLPYRYFFVWFSPLTMNVKALRAVWSKGWGLSSPTVMLGFASSLIWIVSSFAFSLLLNRLQRAK